MLNILHDQFKNHSNNKTGYGENKIKWKTSIVKCFVNQLFKQLENTCHTCIQSKFKTYFIQFIVTTACRAEQV